jgi:hypothetical protein
MSIWRRLTTQGGSSQAFEFTIQTTTSNQIFTLPIFDYDSVTPNFFVQWGDGSDDTITSSNQVEKIHTYSSAGTYTITIQGIMPAFKVGNNSSIRTLIKTIISWGDVQLKEINFNGCSSITTIPGGYSGLSNVESFATFMRATQLSSIPSDIFAYSANATNFTDAFSANTALTSIPSGIFDNNINATTFASAFSGCSNLSSYPSTLFDTNINVVNFSSTFRACRSLTSTLAFTNNTAVTTFANIYYMNTTTNAMDGNAPALWTRVPEPFGFRAFFNCIGLDNYASIPVNWK